MGKNKFFIEKNEILNPVAMGSKFHFSQWKSYFSQFILIDKYLKFKEIEYLIYYFKFKMCPVGNSAHITEFLALVKALLARLYLLYLTENPIPYME